jgi:hypothetical protein
MQRIHFYGRALRANHHRRAARPAAELKTRKVFLISRFRRCAKMITFAQRALLSWLRGSSIFT